MSIFNRPAHDWHGLESLEPFVLLSANPLPAGEIQSAAEVVSSDTATSLEGNQQDPLADFSLEDLNPASATFGQNVGPAFYDGDVSGYYFTRAACGICQHRFDVLNDLSLELESEGITDVRIIGINGPAWAGDDLAGMLAGRVLPFVQDDAQQNVWANWNADWRDVFILDRAGQLANRINLTGFNPDPGVNQGQNYALLKSMFLDARGTGGPDDTLVVDLDVDRTTAEPDRLTFLHDDGEDGTTVSVRLKGRAGAESTLVLTRPDDHGFQQLVSADLFSLEPERTVLSIRSAIEIDVEHITGNGAKYLDLKPVRLTGNSIEMTGSVDRIRVHAMDAGARIELGGSVDDRLQLQAGGAIGEPDAVDGVDLTFPGTVDVKATAWHGGSWDVGRVRNVKMTDGDFSPEIDIAHGFRKFDIRGGDFRPARMLSGTAGTMSDGDGSGGTITARASRMTGHGGAIISPHPVEIDGSLKALQGESYDLTLLAGGDIKSVKQRITRRTEASRFVLDLTANRIGKVQGQGAEARIDLVTTGTADTMGRKPAITSVQIKGAHLVEGSIETAPGTKVRSLELKPRAGVGGQIIGDFNVHVDLLENFRSGDVRGDFTLSGDLMSGKTGRIIGCAFTITGDVHRRFSTNSTSDPDDADDIGDGVLDLINPASANTAPEAPGALSIVGLTNPQRVRTR
ncbi:MAG: hypothetical protein CMJ18_09145 [Phycisphaeraceae bacterium]|nr:hypothetical protein [Phycisphaeraceae bacterium]